MIQVWKTLHEKDDVNPETWFTPMSSSGAVTGLSSDPLNIMKPSRTKNLDIRTNFWTVDTWNNLPLELKSDFVQKKLRPVVIDHFAFSSL